MSEIDGPLITSHGLEQQSVSDGPARFVSVHPFSLIRRE